jgi:hypothetical protein
MSIVQTTRANTGAVSNSTEMMGHRSVHGLFIGNGDLTELLRAKAVWRGFTSVHIKPYQPSFGSGTGSVGRRRPPRFHPAGAGGTHRAKQVLWYPWVMVWTWLRLFSKCLLTGLSAYTWGGALEMPSIPSSVSRLPSRAGRNFFSKLHGSDYAEHLPRDIPYRRLNVHGNERI